MTTQNEFFNALRKIQSRAQRIPLPDVLVLKAWEHAADAVTLTDHDAEIEQRADDAQTYLVPYPNRLSNGDFDTNRYQDVVLADSPDGYWRLGDATATAADLSGNGNDGTTTGAAFNSTGLLTGDDDRAVVFDGASGDIDMASPAVLDNLFDGGGTVEAWIKADTDGENDAGTIASKLSGTGWYFWMGGESGGTMNLNFIFTFSGTDGQWRTTAREITAGQVHHVAVTYNADATTNDPVFYVDGVAVGVTEAATPTGTRDTDAARNFMVGNVPADNQTFDGVIDEVAVYAASLSAAQVLAHYQAGVGLAGWAQDITAGITATTAWTGVQGETFAEQDSIGGLTIEVTASTGTGQASRRVTGVTAAAAEVWNFQAWVKGVAYANATARLRLIWRPSATQASVTSVDVSGEFVELALENQTAPGGTTSVDVYLEIDVTTTGGTGKAWFGKVRAERSAGSTITARARRIIAGEFVCRT